MTTFDRDFWEERWSQVLREHADQVARRPPNAHLTGEVENLRPGRALDAGCGHGSDTLWLAARGWQVTAVDFSAAALAHARSTAEAVGADVAERVDWIEGDLATWTPQPGHYDLVACLYVHVAGSVEEMVRRMAAGVAPGGTLFLVGHHPVDPATGAATPAAGQVQVSVDVAVAALEPGGWEFVVAEDRPRAKTGTGVDAVICARRLSGCRAATVPPTGTQRWDRSCDRGPADRTATGLSQGRFHCPQHERLTHRHAPALENYERGLSISGTPDCPETVRFECSGQKGGRSAKARMHCSWICP